MKALFVFEFGPRSGDHMTADLMEGLCRRIPGFRPRFFHGFLRKYVAGGTRPSRLLNAAYMYAGLPFVLLVWRPDVVFVRTAPPLIQDWAVLLGRLLKIRVGCWMMDYHPEIEARALDRRGFGWIARGLRVADAVALRSLDFVVVLDAAMERLIATRAPGVPLVRHPTWNEPDPVVHEPTPFADVATLNELRLVYAGTLGYAHPLDTFDELLEELLVLAPVHLYVVGGSTAGKERFRALAERRAIELTTIPRQSFTDLGRFFHDERMHAGIVLLGDEMEGIVSPSKFGPYLRFGLPTLYLGPPGTASEAIGAEFGAGFFAPNRAPRSRLKALAHQLTDPTELQRARQATAAAARFFGSRSGGTLAEATAHLFVGTTTNGL